MSAKEGSKNLPFSGILASKVRRENVRRLYSSERLGTTFSAVGREKSLPYERSDEPRSSIKPRRIGDAPAYWDLSCPVRPNCWGNVASTKVF
jgi:hypothetical protein